LPITEYEKKEKDGEILRIAGYPYTKKCRLIVTHNTKRAEKDRKDREKAIEKLRQKLEKSKNPKSLISNYGYKKFLSAVSEPVELWMEKFRFVWMKKR
jgi:hypothetical protein